MDTLENCENESFDLDEPERREIQFRPSVGNSNHSSNDQHFTSTIEREKSRLSDLDILLACTYVFEAFHGRHGYFVPERKQLNYKLSKRSIYQDWVKHHYKLWIYLLYNHVLVRLALYCLIWMNLLLVLFEEPSVPGWGLPYWATMLVELLCMAGYFGRLVHGWAFMPKWRHWKDKKIIVVLVCIALTLIDIAAFLIFNAFGLHAYAIRWTRPLRPAFMINFSESRQVRRAIRNIRRILPEIANVLVLLLLVIALYALLGLKLFQKRHLQNLDGEAYMSNYWDNYFSLYVLTTSANNPDITIPAYNSDPWYVLFFVVFIVVCMYIFVSIFLAVVYKNYRKHLKNEVKSSVYRKRRNLKAAFDCLKIGVDGRWIINFERWKLLLQNMFPKISPVQVVMMWQVLDESGTNEIEYKDFMHAGDLLSVKLKESRNAPHLFEMFCPALYQSYLSRLLRRIVLHRFFVYFFDVVIIANAICIGYDIEESEVAFLAIFNIEIILKLYSLGPGKFFTTFWCIFDFLVIEAATIAIIVEMFLPTLSSSQRVLDFLLVLRVLRLFKILGSIERFEVIINTIMQIGPAISTYGGIMFVLYYFFAIIGMELFHGRMSDGFYGDPNSPNITTAERAGLYCGNPNLNNTTFYRLRYCGINFNDVIKAFVTLLDLTVVNQWHVITSGFVSVTTKAARLYFFMFHLLCVIVVLNIFVAFILEAFMLQYSLSSGRFEAALEKKIEEKNAGIGMVPLNNLNDESENVLDDKFCIERYAHETGMRYRLEKQKTKDAEALLQQMFEDELEGGDLGPETQDLDELNEMIERQEIASPRKLTLNNVDL